MAATVVSKIRCNNPNKNDSALKNREYLKYIATREGVDLTPSLNNPNAFALFGNIKCDNINQVSKYIDRLTSGRHDGTRHNVYRAILSLKEEDAIALGYDNKNCWEQLLRKSITEIGANFGIKIEDLEWTGAVHMEKGHPHCHYMFWSKTPAVASSFIHDSMQTKCREYFSNQINEEERQFTILDKNKDRDTLLNFIGDTLDMELDYLYKGELPSKFRKDETELIRKKIMDISNSLPDSGRMAYKYMPQEIKKQIDEISETILNMSAIKSKYKEYLELNQSFIDTSTNSDKKEEVRMDKALADFRNRVGNKVLKAAVNIHHNKHLLLNESDIRKTLELQEDPFIDNDNMSDQLSLYPNISYYNESKGDYPDTSSYTKRNSNHKVPSVDGYKIEWSKSYKKAMNMKYDPLNKDLDTVISLLDKEANNGNVLALYELGNMYNGNIATVEGTDTASMAQNYFRAAYEGFKALNSLSGENAFLADYIPYRIGKMLEYGQGIEKDLKSALSMYQQCPDNKYAMYRAATLFTYEVKNISENNESPDHYSKKALQMFKMSADEGFPYAAFSYAELSHSLSSNLEYSNIEKKYYQQALNGFINMYHSNPSSNLAYKIGVIYLNGKGTDRDTETALIYLKEASAHDNHFANLLLSKIYLDKNDIHYDPDKAISLLHKLSALDYTKDDNKYVISQAEYTLGKLFTEDDTIRDYRESLKWLRLSTEHGNLTAEYYMAKLFLKEDVPLYNLDHGINILEKLLDIEITNQTDHQLVKNAAYQLGKTYMDNISCINISKAIHYLKVSSNLDNFNADIQLGKIYSDKKSIHYNKELALEYYQMAAKNNNDIGKYHYGKYLCLTGDIKNGILNLNQSYNMGNSNAAVELGSIYLFGKYGIAKDTSYGKHLLQEEYLKGNEFAGNVLGYYDEHLKQFVASQVYTLCKNTFSMLSNLVFQEKERSDSTKAYRVHSKEMKKVIKNRQERESD